MIVCNCNGLSERDIRRAILAGAGSPAEIFAYYDVPPQCELCMPEIGEALAAAATGAHGSFCEVA